MLESNSRHQSERTPTVRTVKIEADGDCWKGLIKPKIRLMGRWLEQAGFRPGQRVHVTCVAPGRIEMRSADTSETVSKPALLKRSGDPI